MGKLGSIATAARQKASDKAFEVRVLREAGVLGLHRPDKSAKVVSAFLRWGASPALGITTAVIHYPHETALIDERGSLTFEQLHRRTNALARAFAQMGIGCEDGVGIMCRNHRGFIEATLAAAKHQCPAITGGLDGRHQFLDRPGIPLGAVGEGDQRAGISECGNPDARDRI